MRKKITAGNWKMNPDYTEAMALADAVCEAVSEDQLSQVILAAPFIYLVDVVELVQDHPNISVAAQNCSDKKAGAFTGEVSASMLASIGVNAVVIGHSERRTFFLEDNVLLSKKVSIALENSLMPIYCCGETWEQRNSNKHFEIIKEQIETGLFHLDKNKLQQCVIAYEPVWAIGTGQNASTNQIGKMHSYIRSLIREKFGDSVAENISILYGGSITQKNASELFACPDVDGGLVGGASLKADEFISIIKALDAITRS